jgi:two-component system, cell cycle sensor histidine kinase and response regulator CckA
MTEMLYVDDSAEKPDQRLLYDPRNLVQSPDQLAAVEAEFRSQLHREHAIELGGRRWVALYRPAPRWIAEQQTLLPELWLLTGLTATSLLAGLISALARRAAAIQQEVEERTKELSESRRQLSSLLHTLPGMAVRCVQDEGISVVFVSEGARSLTGYEADELVANASLLRDLIHPADLELVRMTTRRALQGRNDFEMEFRIRPREGPEKWVLARGHGALGNDGRPLLEGLAIDITERKAAEAGKLAMERTLLESQKLESVGLLAGGIAHDFNNLLAGIVGHANLTRLKLSDDSPALDHLRKIEGGANRAAELCQQMLAYSGRGQRTIEPVDVSRVVQETIPLVHTSLGSQVRIQLQLSDQPAVTMADPTQIRQIAMNLIINAADALGTEGGDIVISTGTRWVDADLLATAKVAENVRPGNYVFLKVSDTGCGMSSGTLARIFDPFFTTKFTGRGLGLAAVLGIVRAHSGALHVESALGKGTTFTLSLPVSSAALPPASSTASATPWRHAGKVLIVDDEAPVREVAAELVRSFGLSVVIAEGGADGVEKFRADPTGFDLVLLDLTMPGMNGDAALAALRSINPQVRVVLASGYSSDDRLAALAPGGSLIFLQKPFTRGQLERKLREFLA